MSAWIAEELEGLDLGDERLNARQHKLLDRLAARPQGSIPEACCGWSETLAAYRFCDNERVTPEKVLAPHREATCRRIVEEPVVLLLQDTTELELDRDPEQGFGKLTYEARIGLMDHTRLAVTPSGQYLGVTGCKLWSRPLENPHQDTHNRDRPLEEKESVRWLEGYRDACEIARRTPQTRIVSISDREGDVYECYVDQPPPAPGAAADWIVRSAQNRCVVTDSAVPDAPGKLREAAAECPRLAQRTVTVHARPGRPQREAVVEVRAGVVTLRKPDRRDETRHTLSDVEVHLVWVHEPTPPPETEPLDWLLLTSLPIDTPEQVQRVVDYYWRRWLIEIYFRTLKTGCRVERLQLETAARVAVCLMLYKIVAWRLLYVTILGRQSPELPCDAVFSETEWQATWSVATETPPPPTPPALAEFLHHVACLGGYLDRNRDPPPGPEIMWRGLRRVIDFGLAWTAFQQNAATKHHSCV